jgi:excinuclease ABC subunit A
VGLSKIIIKGAREHNLKNIDVEIPRDRLVVITGLSGSGKSSLAFDTIYAEGQRRYVESLSAYARQFLGQMEKPEVEYIEGLSPAISIEQKTTSKNPRSTVATVTEIYDYLRLLYARIGIPHCHICGREIASQTPDQIVDRVMELPQGRRFQVLAPLVRGRKGEHKNVLEEARKQGYVRVRVDGEVRDLNEDIVLDKKFKHSIEVVVDRLVMKPDLSRRLADSVETALGLSGGIVTISVADGEELTFSQSFACAHCGISFEELSPRMFSFNSPFGACKTCSGLGTRMEIDPDLVVPDKSLSLSQGAIKPWNSPTGHIYNVWLRGLADHYGFSLDAPFVKLGRKHQEIVLHGSGDTEIEFVYQDHRTTFKQRRRFEGVIPNLERRYSETGSEDVRFYIQSYYMSARPCHDCKGGRLRPEAAAVTVAGKTIVDSVRMSVKEALSFFSDIGLDKRSMMIGKEILKEIRERLRFMADVGLDYLTLDRAAGTLSGGEAQRIRLATQVGSGLVGVLYILDEPSIGLHQRDNARLLATLKRLRDLGNTVVVVEHDAETILSADYIIDLGPGAGVHGGYVVACGTPADIINSPQSVTGQYLKGVKKIEVPQTRRSFNGNYIEVIGASENNLKEINVKVPLGVFTAVTGVSGSGKSTLVNEVLYKALANILNRSNVKAGKHKRIKGIEHLDKVIDIDQDPIGRTPRSNPATYTGLFTPIRDLFASLPEAKMRGYKPGRFSFNVRGGRCEACQGDGIITIEMHFLPDVYVPCEVCKGKRYNRETLEVRYKGKSISEVLDMTVEEALKFFENIPAIRRILETLFDVGLGYIKLGQPATTLSGGEAQRVKLAKELCKKSTGRTVYILDEPTTGLHFADVQKLLDVLNRLTDAGNTVIVIEHNLDVVKTADYIIDLGPEGGDEGGRVIACGRPEEIMKAESSYTGEFLRKVLLN